MIESIELTNFQSHKKSKLEFSPGVNAIKGASDSGKSAILRAFNLLINNKPSGDSYVRHGETRAKVIGVIDGVTIENSRLKASNEYDMDGAVYKALAGKVPQEIEDHINMGEVNIQGQMDSPFLLSETSGEVAKVLNKAVNLSIIDRTNKNISATHRSINTELNYTRNRLTETEGKLNKYKDLPSIGKELDKLKEKKEAITTLKKDIETLEELTDTITLLTVRMEPTKASLKNKEELYDKAVKYTQVMGEIEEKKEQVGLLGKLVSLISSTVVAMNKTEESIKEMEDTVALGEKALIMLKKIQEKKEKLDKFTKSIDRIESMCYSNSKLKEQIRKAEEEYKEMSPNICPLCGK